MSEGQGEKWNGLRNLSRRIMAKVGLRGAYIDDAEAELRRELGPLLEAAEEAVTYRNKLQDLSDEVDKWR